MDSMELLFDSFSDALIDSVKLIPFLLVTYLLMEWLEQRTEEKQKQYMQSAGAFGPLAGEHLESSHSVDFPVWQRTFTVVV